jgi:hypothetical protein
MKAAETEGVYKKACRKRRLRPNQPELEEWHSRLKGHDLADVEQAMSEWDADTSLDLRGQPKSKWLPSAVELANLAAAVAKKRSALSAGLIDVLYWRCGGPLSHRWVEYIGRSVDNAETRICSWCGAAARVETRRPDGE